MKLELKIYDCLCSTEVFRVNDIEADCDDFGSKNDCDQENADEYGCGDMQFDPYKPTEKVLNKYGITELEYNLIADQLKDGLSFGSCGWCI